MKRIAVISLAIAALTGILYLGTNADIMFWLWMASCLTSGVAVVKYQRV